MDIIVPFAFVLGFLFTTLVVALVLYIVDFFDRRN